MKLRRSIVALMSCCILLAPARVYADDENNSEKVQLPAVQVPAGEKDPGNVLTVVRKNYLVPFTGILLSPRAAAEFVAKMEAAKKQAQLDADKAREEQKIHDEAQIKSLQVELKAEKKSSEERLTIRDNRITQLQKDLAKSEASRPNPVTWALIGAGATAVVIGTLATVIVVGSASK